MRRNARLAIIRDAVSANGGAKWGARLAALALAICLTGCAAQWTRDKAQDLLSDGQFEKAVGLLEQGLKDHPANPVLRAGLIQARNEALTRLLTEAAAARASGRLDDAEKALSRAVPFDSGGKRVESLLSDLVIERRQAKALAEATTLVEKKQIGNALRLLNDALKDNPRQPDLRAMQRRLEVDLRQTQVRASQAGLKETRPISLDFRDASLRTVLDLVTRNSGINFILDKDIRSDVRISVYLRSARLEDAIDLITSTHQLSKKVVDSQTILIYPNTPDKQREHQEQIVKVFYLASSEAKGAAAFLRAMLRLKDPFVDERTNMIAIRDSQENIALAERLISLYDTNDPEVLLEVEVIEVRSSRLTELGVKFPDSFSLTALPPVGSTGLTLGNISSLTRDSVALGIGGLLFSLRREVGDFNTLANPRIRVRNREKAKVLIGDKVPVITSTIATGGFAADSVSYVEVGLKLEVEPTVFSDDDVAIKVALEASTLAREIRTASGTLAYQIGTRTASTLLRLRDGETQLLAGLISREDRTASSRLPGVGDLPVLGRLFSNQRDESVRTELVLAITPRVLRNVRRPDATETEMWVGTEAVTRLRPVGGFLAQADATEATPDQTTGQAGAGAGSGSGANASLPAPRLAGPAGAPPLLSVPTAALRWSGPSEVKAGEVFTVGVLINTPLPLRGAPLKLNLGKGLELVAVEEGDFFKQGGGTVNLTQATDPKTGELNIGLLRSDLSTAIGQGTVVNLRLKAAAPGAVQLGLQGFEPIGLQGPSPKPGLPAALVIKVN